MGELPAPVRSAVQKVTAGSTVTEIEKVESGGKVTYEVEYRKDGKEYETHFASDGTILKTNGNNHLLRGGAVGPRLRLRSFGVFRSRRWYLL